MQVIEDYKSTGAIPSKIFILNPAIDFDKISHLILIIDGENTASLELQLITNSLETSTYYRDGHSAIGGTIAGIDIGAEEYYPFATVNIITAADRTIHAEIHIYLPTGGVNKPIYWSNASANGINETSNGFNSTAQTSLTEIEIQTSTSTMKTGTRMTLYKVLR